LECIEVVLATIKEDMFPCIWFKGGADRASDGRISVNAKKELFAGIAHVLVISEFEKAGYLGIGNSNVIPVIVRSNVIYVYVGCPFCYVNP
jgi:hypothetical protein